MFNRYRNIISFLLIFIVSIIISCNPTTRFKIIDTLFDGVPPLENEKKLSIGDTLGQIDSTRIVALEASINFNKTIYHVPYKDKDCASCHDDTHLGEFTAEEPELCFQCHDDNEQDHSFKHGPSGAGYCTSCHQPHLSPSSNLLIKDGNDLCYSCHELNSVSAIEVHKEIKDREDCINCHNPHSSENRFMLQVGACLNCHKEKINDNKVTHGPVSANYCSSCHQSHASSLDMLLAQSGKDLCLSCHDESNIYTDEEHQNNKDEDCIVCHDPHGSKNEYMLKELP